MFYKFVKCCTVIFLLNSLSILEFYAQNNRSINSQGVIAKYDKEFTKPKNKVILFVWDGFRRDVISKEITPNLYNLKTNGSFFSDHHSSYPTVTMNNANSLATGNYSGGTGFYGNEVWRPDIEELKTKSKTDFNQPVFVQKHDVLVGLDKPKNGKPLMYVDTLIQVARKHGLKTAQIGKPGPVALQDAHNPTGNGVVLTAHNIYPLSFAKRLLQNGYLIPKKAANLYSEDELLVDTKNLRSLKPNKFIEIKTLDGTIPLIGLSNPKVATEALARESNEYLMNIYLNEILPIEQPDLSVVWFNEPDKSSHKYGPGSKPFFNAVRNQDKLLGQLLKKLKDLNIDKSTNIIIASDHGHSNVSGDQEVFPLREISNSSIGKISKTGFSASGSVRVADLLTKAGFKAYDGEGCIYNPVMSGVFADKNLSKPINVDQSGTICNDGPGRLYTSKSYKVPDDLQSEDIVVVASNGGSVFLYVPDNNKQTVIKLVRFLQSRLEFDSIFIDRKYGDLPGTLPMSKVNFYDDEQQRHPDLLVSMSYHEKQQVQGGLPGTIYTSSAVTRGSHGSLSPIDIQNIFIGYGPDFKSKYVDELPTANVDVPVTMAYLLNLPFEDRTGRPALEAIANSGVKAGDYNLKFTKHQPTKPATNLKIMSLVNKDNEEYISEKNSYTFVLNTKQLYYKGQIFNYIDSGKATRY